MADTPPDHPDTSEAPDSARRHRKEHRRGLKRSSAACQRCRKRKQKCDAKHPVCTPCAQAGAECVPSERLVIRIDPDCECDDLRARVEALQEQVRRLQAQRDPSQCPPFHDIGGGGESKRPSYWGRILLPTFPQRSRPASSQLHGEQDTSFLSSPWHLWGGVSPDAPDNGRAFTSPWDVPFDLYGPELSEAFFARRWPQLPVLHRRTFTRLRYDVYADYIKRLDVRQGVQDGQGRNEGCVPREEQEDDQVIGLAQFQTNIVLAIGCVEKPRIAGHTFSHHEFFKLAVACLPVVLNTSDDTLCLQCLLLLCMYGINEPQSVNLWYTAGLALRLALGVDLHRKESLASRESLLEAEMAKRLFWCVYTLDRSLSIAMGRPLGIPDSDISMPLPLCISDDVLASEVGATGAEALQNMLPQVDDTSTFIHVIKLRRLNTHIHNALHTTGSSTTATGVYETTPLAGLFSHLQEATGPSEETLSSLRHRCFSWLNEWLVTAPRYTSQTSMFQSNEWFQIAYHQAVINLHRPSHASLSSTSSSSTSSSHHPTSTATPSLSSTSSISTRILPPPPTAAIPRPSSHSSHSTTNTNTNIPNGPNAHSIRLCADASISLISAYGALYAKNRVSYTFIALNSLFLAGVTMLWALRASPQLRSELGRDVAERNVRSCADLIEEIACGREVGGRCAGIVRRLGAATCRHFWAGGEGGPRAGGGHHHHHQHHHHYHQEEDDDIDTEFLQWFGLRGKRPRRGRHHHHHQQQQQQQEQSTPHQYQQQELLTPSVDLPWYDLFDNGFDINAFVSPEFCI